MIEKTITPLRSKALTRLLVLISKGFNYGQQIHKMTGKNPAPICQQLSKLERLGYLKSVQEKSFNKKIFKINNAKLFNSFKEFCKKNGYEKLYLKKGNLRRIDIPNGLFIDKVLFLNLIGYFFDVIYFNPTIQVNLEKIYHCMILISLREQANIEYMLKYI
jgi:hypothetical protein